MAFPGRKCTLFIVLLMLISILARSAEAQELGSPAEQMQWVHNEVINLLSSVERAKAQPQSTAQINAAIAFIEKRLAISSAAAHIYGRAWGDLDDLERMKFIDALLSVYRQIVVDQIIDYIDKAPTLKEVKVKGDKARVRYSLEIDNALSSIVYSLRKQSGSWLIYDINKDGVSLLRNFIAQLKPVIQSRGIDGAVAELQTITEKSSRPD